VTKRKSLLAFLLPDREMPFSRNSLYTAFQVASSMWILTIHRLFRPFRVVLLVAISGITSAQLMMFLPLKIGKTTAASNFLTCTKFEMESKLPKFSSILVCGRANQHSRKAPSSFWSLIWNSRCSCHGRCPFSAP
jgi:hypothetical protein